MSPLSPCPCFGRCPLDSGCRTPSRSRQSLFCRGQSGAGGAGLGRVPPNTNQEGECVYPSSWGRTAGSVHCKIYPPPRPGEGRPLRSPLEQRVSVAHDSSKETRGNKCATNRWGGYLGKDAARQAGGQPPPRQGRLAGSEGLRLAPPAWGGGLRGLHRGQAEAGLHALALLSPWGQHPYGHSKDISGFLCWVSLLGSGTVVQGAARCLLALPLLPPSLMCHRPQLFFGAPERFPGGS